ncbi:Por secretion system C-terminal sorting domain-containing protein [Chryseobacterium rhizoplanae]|uniref:Por secretion system C-terminal sorting domain-containing protein n=1 Tax=Chryseobacterium rhizoplanae TaxID=1609531 RepID=A0A521FC87_9FLAO|nr:T9SS type A sorting domain-containing protein [Chryseobacterium rhizoplanae]SMO93756.1 Por secretion system C-terminal sorting domain-containing protein [Chryseobacterium rhizoplanae]
MKLKTTLLLIGFFAFFQVKSQYSTGTVPLFSTPGGADLAYSVKIDLTPSLVTLTLIGPSTGWLGMAFNTTNMDDIGKDVVIFDGTNLSDRTFNGQGVVPPLDGTQNWTVTSNTVAGSVRTVIATRALNTGDANDYVFTVPPAGPLNITYGRRLSNFTIGYHGSNSCGTTSLNFGTLGTKETASENKKIVLYPNPAQETVSFKNADKIKSVDIYESAGRKVRSVKLEGENISVRDLKSGTYYFEITLKDGTTSYEKLIKE